MPFDFTTPYPSAAQAAHDSLRDHFATIGHHPSALQWAAIRDLLDHLERAATGTLDPCIYVSSLPAGVGKSSAIQAFTAAICNAPHYPRVSILIACHRLEEVEAMARSAPIKAHRQSLCVIVGADKANDHLRALGGHTDANKARIVLTTQAALKMTLRHQSDFNKASRYHFQGQRRAVICWDEAISVNRPISINSDTIFGLIPLIRGQSGKAAEALIDAVAAIGKAPGGPFLIPDLQNLGVSFSQLISDAGDTGDLAAMAKALEEISGDWAHLHKCGDDRASAILTHVREIPASLFPVIVTDASATLGVHGCAYDQMGTNLPVKRMKDGPKEYANLSITIAPQSASRSIYREKNGTRALDIINTTISHIRKVAPDNVLIVSYGTVMKMSGIKERTIAEAISNRLTPEEQERVRHITWGNHTATNDYRDFPQVVLMGLHFLPSSASYGASGAALDKSMKTNRVTDHPTKGQISDMEKGMLRDATFQAIMRGNARKSIGGDCGPMKVLIFQGSKGLKKADYQGMFPGSNPKEDKSLRPEKARKSRIGELTTIVMRTMANGADEVSYTALIEEMSQPKRIDRRDFMDLLKHGDVVGWMDETGIEKVSRPKGCGCFKKIFTDCSFEDQ